MNASSMKLTVSTEIKFLRRLLFLLNTCTLIVHTKRKQEKETSYLAFRVRTKIIHSIKPIWYLKLCDDEVLFYVGLLLKREICDRNLLLFFVILHLDKPN